MCLILQAAGLAWIATVATRTITYSHVVGGFILSGTGMELFFAPVANLVLSTVQPHEEADGLRCREAGHFIQLAVLPTDVVNAADRGLVSE